MRILVISGTSDRPETALLCGLAERGHNILLLGTPLSEQRQLLRSKGIEIESFEAKNRFDFKAAAYLKRKIKSWRPQIVHAFSGRTLAAAVRAKSVDLQFKLVTYRGTVGHLSKLDPGATCSFLNPKVDAISCVSNAVKRYLVGRGVPEKKLYTIYKGHDPLWYQSPNTVTLDDLKISQESFTVICVANARPVKGVDIFIGAANQLSSYKNIYFLIVGDIRDQGLQCKAQNTNIRFLGFRKDAQSLIKISNCLIVPSRGREGLPKALLEAMALEKPIIASKVGGIPEVIKNEQDGLLIPPNDPGILARAILFLSDNPDKCLELGKAGNEKLLADFNVCQMVEKTERMYRGLV